MDRTRFTNPFEILDKLQEEEEQEDKHDNNNNNTVKKKSAKKAKKQQEQEEELRSAQAQPEEEGVVVVPGSERDYRTRILHGVTGSSSNGTPHSHSAAFSILSYNILAQHYVKTNFPYCKQKYLSFDYRNDNLINELCHYNADIMCLQEVEKDHLENYLKPSFEGNGYAVSFKKRPTIKKDGVAIFYRMSKFTLLTSKYIEFIKTPPSQLPTDDPSFDPRRLQKGNVGAVVVLKINGRQARSAGIIVANCHIYFKVDDELVREVQWNQVDAFLSFIAKVNKQYGFPVILCGDFNSQPNGLVYRHIINQSKKLGYSLQSAYANTSPDVSRNGEPAYTNFTAKFKDCLDYIWLEKDKVDLVSVMSIPNEETLSKEEALPNQHFSSDHLALMSTIQLRKHM